MSTRPKPIGYDADGRTLSINEAEAATVRTLYDLYEPHQTVRAAKEHADRLKLQTTFRTAGDGTVRGGGPFARGHIHHILTNPLYAGRIRHRKSVHEGQHPALFDAERWDRIQAMLQDGAAKDRRTRYKSQSSILCGKLSNETGDRFTPSHTKTRSGKRLRYYISHRLIAKSGKKNLDGWRLPAPELEAQLAALIRMSLATSTAAPRLINGTSSDDFGKAQASLTNWLGTATQTDLIRLAKKITIEPGQLTVQINPHQVADILDKDTNTLNERALEISSVFQIRKRGVETKLIFADMPTGQDDVLILNIAKAHSWFEQMKAGKTFAQIADAEKTSKTPRSANDRSRVPSPGLCSRCIGGPAAHRIYVRLVLALCAAIRLA